MLLETLTILQQLQSKLLQIGGAVAVLIVGWLLIRFLSKMIERLLKAVKLDSIGDKISEIDMLQTAKVKIKLSAILSTAIYYILLLVLIASVTQLVQLDFLSEKINDLINYIPQLFSATLILIGGLIVANMIRGVLNAAFQSLNVASGKLISGFVFYFIFISVALSALPEAGFEVKFLQDNLTIIIGGIVLAFAIGYGFASRNIMSNLLAALYSRSKFQIGDDVKIGGVRGTVIEMDSTSITLATSDRRVVIPLNHLTQEQVEIFGNWNENPRIED